MLGLSSILKTSNIKYIKKLIEHKKIRHRDTRRRSDQVMYSLQTERLSQGHTLHTGEILSRSAPSSDIQKYHFCIKHKTAHCVDY